MSGETEEVLSGEDVHDVYSWLDRIPLSRPKKHLQRDFADGVLMAEVANFCVPGIADLHNYSAAHSFQQKKYNWDTLNSKVFKRLAIPLSAREIEGAAAAVPGAVEKIILKFRRQVAAVTAAAEGGSSPTAALRGSPREISSSGGTSSFPGFPRSREELVRLLMARDQTICALEESNSILQAKTESLQKLVALKESKIEYLLAALQQANVPLPR